MARNSTANPAVAELQGLYGPFSFPEKLLQKIWLRGDFAREVATTTDGRRVRVRHPGKWNLLGGPDFRGARLRFGDDAEITGDVEVHLHAEDWAAHAHAGDAAYREVALHVVLFPPAAGHATIGADGRAIPVLALLPLLHHDLEEFAADEAVASLAGRAGVRISDELAALDATALHAMLRAQAAARWRQKVHFARLRVQRLGWDAACHHAALEILGYRFNRAPMLHIAARWALGEWARGAVVADDALAAEADAWSVQGVRPANHPRTRLRQYAQWARECPGWPARLAGFAAKLPRVDHAASARAVRRAHGFTAWRARIAKEICGGAVGGTRLDNLVCDGFLPLLAARDSGGPEALSLSNGLQGLWSHWFTGDLPSMLARGLRELGVFDGRANPASHGAAQGLLGWLLEREACR